MPNTTNFNWATPADTDLVKDGAAAIRTLGSSIDTSFVDLKGGTTGQVLSKASNTDLDFSWVAQDDSNAIQNALLTTTGDTIYASAASTPARLGLGTAGQVLQVNSGATAPEWVTPSSGGMTQISTGTLSGAQVDITSIPGTYIHLQLIITNLLPATDGSTPKMRINANTGSVYFDGPFGGFGGAYTAASSVGLTNNGYDNVSANGLIIGNFYNYAGNTWKFWDFMVLNNDETTATSFDFRNQGGTTNQTAAITQINLFMSSGNFTSGTWTLYGVK